MPLAVLMMHVLMLSQGAAKMLLHDLSMLHDLSAIDHFDNIAISVNAPRRLSLGALGALKGNLGLAPPTATQIWLASRLMPLTKTCFARRPTSVFRRRLPLKILQRLLLAAFRARLQQSSVSISINVLLAAASEMTGI